MKIGTFNARSLVNKTVGVMEHLQEVDCDIYVSYKKPFYVMEIMPN